MTRQHKINKIKDLHQFFIKKIRPKRPISLIICELKECHGLYYYNKKKDIIVINKKDNLATMYDNWVHEIGHALQRGKNVSESSIKDHSDDWGRCYARAYRIFLEWDKLQK